MPRRLDVTAILAVAVAALLLRLPASVILLVLSGPVVILVRGLHLHTRLHAPLLWSLHGTGLVCSLLAQADSPEKLLGINSAAIITGQLLLAVAALRTGAPRMALRWITSGLYAGLCGLYFLGVYEVVTGDKMLPRFYPDASSIDLVHSSRILATAIFPNYNDFSVALVFLAAVCVTRLFFGRGRSQLGLLVDAVILATSTVWIFAMGSRGALLALVMIVAVAALASVMALHPGLVRPVHVTAGAVLLAGGVGLLWTTPWLQDNSTKARVTILEQASAMMGEDPFRLLFGWGSYADYKVAANVDYPGQLMDTHNLLLEIVVSYGLPTLLVFLACWVFVIVRGLLQQRIDRDWRSLSMVVMASSLPLLGVVPSSLLRYHWPFLVMTACFIALAVWERDATDQRSLTPR